MSLANDRDEITVNHDAPDILVRIAAHKRQEIA